MTTLDSEALNLIDLMLEDFSNRLRAGENPSIESYIQKHPILEHEIREALSIAGRIESVQRQEGRRSRQSSKSDLPRATDPFPTLTNYRFIREIGRGGMGVVFEAEHVELRRRVALKILAPHLSQDPTAKKRFQREARAASKLQHPNIVPIHDIGEENELAYFTMPLIQGMSLDHVIQMIGVRSKSNDSRDFSASGLGIKRPLTNSSPSNDNSKQTQPLQVAIQRALFRRQSRRTFAPLPRLGSRSQMGWATRTAEACCIAISSQPTSYSMRRVLHGSAISG